MRNPRWGNFAAVFAGPLFSFILAVIAAIPLRFGLVELPEPFEASQAIPTAQQVLWYMAFINIFLFLFNLLPLFPLDGWTVMAELLPRDPAGIWWQRNQTNSMYVLYGLIALSFIAPRLADINPVLRFVDIIGQMILPPAFQLMDLLVGR
jgi:Zn-dependent protease